MKIRMPFSSKRSVAPGAPITVDDFAQLFSFQGLLYPYGLQQTLLGTSEKVADGFSGYIAGAYKRDGIVAACEFCRLLHFSEARFQFRQLRRGRPQGLFGTAELGLLEQPWPGGTTGDLLARMLLHADFGGNAFVARRVGRVTLLRPDWVTIVAGSTKSDDGGTMWDPDAEVIGYVYEPGGPGSGAQPVKLNAEEVAHFAPLPDPDSPWRGMSWLTPVIQDVLGDRAATTHKLKFFENGATPNLIVKHELTDPEKARAFIDLFREGQEGSANAYKTLFLGAGADATPVGANFQQLDFKSTVGVSETRIAAAAGVPPVIVGLSEGLQGSSLNAGNYQAARRRFADGTMRPLWRNAAGSLARIINVPAGAELWYDTGDVAFLKEDEKDAAEILQMQAAAMRQLVDGGFEPKSVVSAVTAGDLSLLTHSGKLSVQLQEPGAQNGNGNGNGNGSADPEGRALVAAFTRPQED